MGLFDTLFGGYEDQTTTSESTSAPWEAADPYLRQFMESAWQQYGGEPEQYHGQVYAPMNQTQRAGLNTTLDTAYALNPELLDPTFNAYREMIASPMDVADTPGLMQMQEAFARDTGQQLSDYVLPQMQASGAGLGHRGSSRMDLARGLAGDRASQSIADNNMSMLNNAYNARLNQQTQALGYAPSMAGLAQLPGQMIYGVGDTYQNDEQMRLDLEHQRWLGNQQVASNELANYANIFTGLGSMGGTQTGTQTQPVHQEGMFGQLMGGIGMATGLGSSLFGGGSTANMAPSGFTTMPQQALMSPTFMNSGFQTPINQQFNWPGY